MFQTQLLAHYTSVKFGVLITRNIDLALIGIKDISSLSSLITLFWEKKKDRNKTCKISNGSFFHW